MTHVGKVDTKSQNMMGTLLKFERGGLGQVKETLHPTVNSKCAQL